MAVEHFSYQDFLKSKIPKTLEQVPVFGATAAEFASLCQQEGATERNRKESHITTSAVVLNATRESVLFLFHKKYQEWVYPGGHADGDWLWVRSAAREVMEETGCSRLILLPHDRILNDEDVRSCDFSQREMLPLLVQQIPIRASESFPEHVHWDVVYAFAMERDDVKIVQDESLDWCWFPVQNLSEQSALRGSNIPSITRNVCSEIVNRLSQRNFR